MHLLLENHFTVKFLMLKDIQVKKVPTEIETVAMEVETPEPECSPIEEDHHHHEGDVAGEIEVSTTSETDHLKHKVETRV